LLTQIKNIAMEFKGVRALDDINLEIESGEFIAILGPSGCGKTTLLRLLAGFNKPADGEIYINGTVVASKKYVLPPNMRNISMVFQSYALWPHMTVYKNIEFPIKNSKFVPPKIKSNPHRRVSELIELVGLTGMEKRLPGQLSGGQRQRVALARALAIEPALLLMDEPLSNLDTALRIEMRREIKRLHDNTKATILYVTHDQAEALALSDRIVVINKGKIQQTGTPQELYTNPETPFVAKFVGASNLIPGKWSDDGFFCPNGGSCVWEGKKVNPLFQKEGLFPVKPESIHISKENSGGLPAVIAETEYQGIELRLLLSLESGDQVEVRYRGNESFSRGQKVAMVV
jgi:iron(III) transport system ATP-binding protein